MVEAFQGRVPVIVDGGFMRGADVVKGLCFAADIVGMGRFEGWCMAAGGNSRGHDRSHEHERESV